MVRYLGKIDLQKTRTDLHPSFVRDDQLTGSLTRVRLDGMMKGFRRRQVDIVRVHICTCFSGSKEKEV